MRPPGAGTTGRPPAAVRGRRQGTRGPPPLPLPLRPKSERTQTGETAAPHPPGEAAAPRGGARRTRQAPPVNCLHAPALPATDRRRTSGTQDGANGAAPSEAGLGKAGARTRARRSLPSPPPPAALTHWRPTGPRLTPTAARQPPQHEYTPGGRAGDKGWQADTRRGGGAGGGGSAPPPPPHPAPPPGLRAAGAPTPHRPGAKGTPPLPQKRPHRGGGGRSWTCTPRAAAPPAACSRRSHGRWASPHQRAGATRGPRPGAARGGAPEQYGGRAPHDQSIASDTHNVAHSGRAEGSFGSEGAPGGAVHGPPLLPPPPPARQAPPGARGGLDPDRTRTPGGNAPTMRGGAG